MEKKILECIRSLLQNHASNLFLDTPKVDFVQFLNVLTSLLPDIKNFYRTISSSPPRLISMLARIDS